MARQDGTNLDNDRKVGLLVLRKLAVDLGPVAFESHTSDPELCLW